MTSEEEVWFLLRDQDHLEQRWYLFLSLGALWAEATNGAILPVDFWSSLRLVLLETLGTFGLQLVGQVMEDAHTVFHRLMETKESNNYYICLFTTTPLLGVKTKSYATSDQQYLTFAFFLVERQDDVYYSQATTSFVDCNVLPRNLRMDKI